MTRIRKVEIRNFRSIKSLSWAPKNGINCLIGPGDSGKSSILDAMDFCIGAKRNVQFHDTDFYELKIEEPISISVTIGELDDALKNFESYGLFLRGYCQLFDLIHDEPSHDLETVLTVNLSINGDLEPVWSLVSNRAGENVRNLNWADRLRISPTRIGSSSENNLSWRPGSILNKISEERANASAALTKAARDARNSFGNSANEKLREALSITKKTAASLGIKVDGDIKALLDMRLNSFGGNISLHNNKNIPLRNLGDGSSRLLIAGLQKEAAGNSSIILIDEVEYGLEPHRIIRLLGSLGSKEETGPLQVFMTTHSPTALRELNGDQLAILRKTAKSHRISSVDLTKCQGVIRGYPEAFLAPSVLVCEGKTEIGLIRGFDQHRSSKNNSISIAASGVSLLEAGGVSKIFGIANCFPRLGYRVGILRDDDKKPDPKEEKVFENDGGVIFKWSDNFTTEDEIFTSLSEAAIIKLVDFSIRTHGENVINDQIKSASSNSIDLKSYKNNLNTATRKILAKASKSGEKKPWFKTIYHMEEAARTIIAPDIENASEEFRTKIDNLFNWMNHVDEN